MTNQDLPDNRWLPGFVSKSDTALLACALLATLGPLTLRAAEPGKSFQPLTEDSGKAVESVVVEEKSFSPDDIFDKIWALPILYKNPENPFIQKIAFTGRYHGQVFGLNSDAGSASGWQNRRARFGGKVEFLETMEAYVTFNANFEGATTGRFVENLEDFGVVWEPISWFNVEAGLFKVPITNEWRESSNRIITIERSNFINQAIAPKLGGALITGEVKGFTEGSAFTYGGGLYSAARTEDWEAPALDGSAMIYSGVGYKFSDTQTVRFDNGIMTGENERDVTRPYSYTAALNYEGFFLSEKLRLQSDLVTAIADKENSNGDLFGLIVLPSYKLTDRIEFVGRYQYLFSNEDRGVSAQSRYERRAPDLTSSRGNNYHAIYAGANFYVYRDKMKFMTGLEYSHLDLPDGEDFNQLTLFAAFRVWF